MDLNQDVKYLFWISLIIAVLAYWAGAIKVGPVLGQQLVNVIYASSGRDKNGNYPAYPANAPTS